MKIKRNAKKALSLCCAAVILVSAFAGCGSSSSSSSSSSSGSSSESSSSGTLMSNEEIIKKAAADGKVGNWGLGNEYEILALLQKYDLPTDYLAEDFTMHKRWYDSRKIVRAFKKLSDHIKAVCCITEEKDFTFLL